MFRDPSSGKVSREMVDIDQYIISGDPINWADEPFMAQIVITNEGAICGGGILHKNYQGTGYGVILTAGHCVDQFTNLEVRVGCESLYESDSSSCQSFRVLQTILHESYNPNTISNDIALLITDEIDIAEAITIELPDTNPYAGATVNLVGYGRVDSGAIPNELQKAESIVISNTDCRNRLDAGYSLGGYVLDTMVCTWDGEDSSCNGDSGSPATLTTDGRTAVGIVSWGIRGCPVEYPSVYTRVSSYNGWITSNVDSGTANPPPPPGTCLAYQESCNPIGGTPCCDGYVCRYNRRGRRPKCRRARTRSATSNRANAVMNDELSHGETHIVGDEVENDAISATTKEILIFGSFGLFGFVVMAGICILVYRAKRQKKAVLDNEIQNMSDIIQNEIGKIPNIIEINEEETEPNNTVTNDAEKSNCEETETN